MPGIPRYHYVFLVLLMAVLLVGKEVIPVEETVYVPEELVRQLTQRAESEKVSVEDFVGRAIQNYLDGGKESA